MRAGRPLLVFVGALLLTAGLVFAILQLLLPGRMVVEADPRPPSVHEPLTERLLLVVVDGLRYDFATDPTLMPRFSRAMTQHTSGEVWAARVSMTTSAILAYGTGQPGRLEQVLRNLNPDPSPFNSLFENAKRRGVSTALAGDPTWVHLFGSHIDQALTDPPGVAIDVDFNPQTFRDTRTVLRTRPGLMVAHFVTPDHQGHAYGVHSERYRAHLRDYDRQLFELLSEVPPDVTVVVTSDHGATDTGTHGSDSAEQRRCPLFAYGPGIRKSQGLRVEQIDMAATFSLALGLQLPAHGRGFPVLEWLELSPDREAELACAEAEARVRYVTQVLGAEPKEARAALEDCATAQATQRVAAGRLAVRRADRVLDEATGISSPRAWGTALLAVFGCLALAWGALGRLPLRPIAAGAVVLGVAIPLVYGTEKLPGQWPNVVRATLFVVCLLPVLVLLVSPARVARAIDRLGAFAPIVLPGVLLATYTTNVQVLSFVAMAVCLLLFMQGGAIHADSAPLWRRPPKDWLGVVVSVLALGLLWKAATRSGNFFPLWMFKDVTLSLLGACGAVVAGAVVLGRGTRRGLVHALAGAALVCVCLVFRDLAPPWFGRPIVLVLAVGAWVLVRKGAFEFATMTGLASYVWLSRNFEVPAVVAFLVLADQASRSLVGTSEAHGRQPRTTLLLLLTFGFALGFLQRVAITGNLDFGGLDFKAGTFGDPAVQIWVIASALLLKYTIPLLLTWMLLTRRLPRPSIGDFGLGLVLVALGRVSALVLMLFFCGNSYWTALRVLSELPFGLLALAVSAAFWAECRRTPREVSAA